MVHYLDCAWPLRGSTPGSYLCCIWELSQARPSSAWLCMGLLAAACMGPALALSWVSASICCRGKCAREVPAAWKAQWEFVESSGSFPDLHCPLGSPAHQWLIRSPDTLLHSQSVCLTLPQAQLQFPSSRKVSEPLASKLQPGFLLTATPLPLDTATLVSWCGFSPVWFLHQN